MSLRMYKHMKNTLKDIKTELKKADLSADQKVRNINDLINLLESVECGEVVTSGYRQAN